MTKWAHGVHTAIHDNVFWLWVYCSNKSREPLTHFMLWVQKFTNDWPVFRLVCGQLDEFMAEFNEVVSSFDEWFATAMCESGCDRLCNQALQQLRSEVMDVTLLHVAGFRRRIFDPFQKRDCCVTLPFINNCFLPFTSMCQPMLLLPGILSSCCGSSTPRTMRCAAVAKVQ